MRFISFRALQHRFQSGKRLIGLDVGTKFCGVSVSDYTNRVAHPVTCLMRNVRDNSGIQFSHQLAKIIKEFDADTLIVGDPVNYPIQQTRIRNLVEQMWDGGICTPVHLADESCSTAIVVHDVMNYRKLGSVHKMKKAEKSQVDRLAATIILQRVLDSLNGTDDLQQLDAEVYEMLSPLREENMRQFKRPALPDDDDDDDEMIRRHKKRLSKIRASDEPDFNNLHDNDDEFQKASHYYDMLSRKPMKRK